jgi:hypothetical protein
MADIKGENAMKNLVSMIVALGLAVAFSGAAFAKTPTTKHACVKAHMVWTADAGGGKCTKG